MCDTEKNSPQLIRHQITQTRFHCVPSSEGSVPSQRNIKQSPALFSASDFVHHRVSGPRRHGIHIRSVLQAPTGSSAQGGNFLIPAKTTYHHHNNNNNDNIRKEGMYCVVQSTNCSAACVLLRELWAASQEAQTKERRVWTHYFCSPWSITPHDHRASPESGCVTTAKR